MKAKALAHLVSIWSLVGKDPSTKTIYLDSSGARLTGLHTEASRRATLPLETGLTVDGALLAGALKLFPDSETVKIRTTDVSLIITAGERRALLRVSKAEPPEKRLEFKAEPFDGAKLRDALPFLMACTAEGVQKPVLTGIHFKRNGELEATDGDLRSGLLKLNLPFKTNGQSVPAADLDSALSLLGGPIRVKFTSDHMLLRDKTTVIKISLLQGEYPNMAALPGRKTFKHWLSLDKADLDIAIQASTLIDDDRLVVFQIEDGAAWWKIRSQETGGFRHRIGTTNLPAVRIVFDANWLEATQHLGKKIKFRYNKPNATTLFSGKKRLLWMSPVVAA